MLRKYDRIIGTLLIWIAILFVMYFVLSTFTYPRVTANSVWYWPGNIVVSADPEAANQAMKSVDQVSNGLYWAIDSFTRDELLRYAPALLLLVITVMAGGLVSTFFIWRNTRLPQLDRRAEDALASKLKNRQPLRHASLSNQEDQPDFTLAEDGELLERQSTSRSRSSRS